MICMKAGAGADSPRQSMPSQAAPGQATSTAEHVCKQLLLNSHTHCRPTSSASPTPGKCPVSDGVGALGLRQWGSSCPAH